MLYPYLLIVLTTSLNMQQAVSLALQRNQHMIAERLQVDTAEINKIAAGMLPNPELSYNISNIIVGNANPQDRDLKPGRLDQIIQTVGIEQVLDVWGKRRARVRTADIAIQVSHNDVEDAVRNIRYATQTAFAHVLREQWESALTEQIKNHYQNTIVLSKKRLQAGDIATAELRKIELEGFKYNNNAINAAMELAMARQELATLLAFDSVDSLPNMLQDETLPSHLQTLDTLTQQALSKRPDLKAHTAYVAQAEAQVVQARREAWFDITLNLGYTHSKFGISGDNPDTLSSALSIPLPLFDRNQAGIAQALIALHRAQALLSAMQQHIHKEVTDAYLKHVRSHKMIYVFETEMLAHADDALSVAEKSYEKGAISLLESLEARRTFIETRFNYLDTRYQLMQAMIDVAYATGGELP